MPTAYTDQFFTVDPGAPPPVGTTLTFQQVEFIDEDDDGNIETGTGDTFNGTAITRVWQDDTLTINVPGVGDVTYTGVTFYLADGQPAVFTPTDGQVLQNGTFVSSTFVTTATQTAVGDFGPTCFTPGTMIETPDGPRAVETLKEGDLVLTKDAGAQPIIVIFDDTFRATHEIAPILFNVGAIGNTVPLMVSPQHRILITGWQSELLFGEDELLVAAKHLVNGRTVHRVEGGTVRYIHLLFADHQIIWGQGIPSESFYPGHPLDRSDEDVQSECALLFPDMVPQPDDKRPFVRPVLRGHEGRVLAA